MLDIGKNEFNDHSFNEFASALRHNQTLQLLDISRNKDLSDEGSLVTLVQSIAFNRSIQTLDLSGLRIRKPFLKSHFEPALKSNITLQYVNGKFQQEVIEEQLQTNITIENEILPNFAKKAKVRKGDFRIKLVDALNTSAVYLADSSGALFEPALKFVKYHDIRICDFTGLQLQDTSMQLIADYLTKNPNLRSLIIDNNEISDDGIIRIATALKVNAKLAHFSFRGCAMVTDEGLQELCNVVARDNTVLFQIQFDADRFGKELA